MISIIQYLSEDVAGVQNDEQIKKQERANIVLGSLIGASSGVKLMGKYLRGGTSIG